MSVNKCKTIVPQGNSITSFIDNHDGTATAFVGSTAVGTVTLPVGHGFIFSDLLIGNVVSGTASFASIRQYIMPAGTLVNNGDSVVVRFRVALKENGGVSKCVIGGVGVGNSSLTQTTGADANNFYEYRLIRTSNTTLTIEGTAHTSDVGQLDEENRNFGPFLTGLDLDTNTVTFDFQASTPSGVNVDVQYLTAEIIKVIV